MKQLPSDGGKVLTEYGPVSKYRVRVVEAAPGTSPHVDVREFITNREQGFEGFTRRGIHLTCEEAEQLIDRLKQCVANIKSRV